MPLCMAASALFRSVCRLCCEQSREGYFRAAFARKGLLMPGHPGFLAGRRAWFRERSGGRVSPLFIAFCRCDTMEYLGIVFFYRVFLFFVFFSLRLYLQL